MTVLYQLLPWRTDPVDGTADDPALQRVRSHAEDGLRNDGFWQTGVDEDSLRGFHGWCRSIDATFLNDRTTIVLGDHPTVGSVKFDGGVLVEDPAFATSVDGTVPDSLARVAGVVRVFKARGAEHMMPPMTLSVIAAVRDVLAGRVPRVDRVQGLTTSGVPFLAVPEDAIPKPRPTPVEVVKAEVAPAAVDGRAAPAGPVVRPYAQPLLARAVSPPPFRRLESSRSTHSTPPSSMRSVRSIKGTLP
jgi:hypothetical protein